MRPPPWVEALAEEWLNSGEQREAVWAGDPVAAALRWAAGELEARAVADAETALTVAEAAQESGYSQAHLRDLAHQGALELADEGEVMRVRRGDLPRKPGRGSTRAVQKLADRLQRSRDTN